MPNQNSDRPNHKMTLEHYAILEPLGSELLGSQVIFNTVIGVKQAISGFTLTVTLPAGIKKISHYPDAPSEEIDIETDNVGDISRVKWKVGQTWAKRKLDYKIIGLITMEVEHQDQHLGISHAEVKLRDQPQEPITAQTFLIPIFISHVAELSRRYIGEEVTFHTQIKFLKALSEGTLTVQLPPEIEYKSFKSPEVFGHALIQPNSENKRTDVTWNITKKIEAGSCFDCEVKGEISKSGEEPFLESVAEFSSLKPSDKPSQKVSAYARIEVPKTSDYMRYLPGIYQKEDNQLMGRFLMLFESFWKPIEEQIDNIPFYFDPLMTPSSLLRWLGSLLNVELNDNWPEERQRELIRKAGQLYRERGTSQGLKRYLETCTGGQVIIEESRYKNMILGEEAILGGIALGRGNKPHTFKVTLRLSEASMREKPQPGTEEYERQIRAIIDVHKPAHTKYDLKII